MTISRYQDDNVVNFGKNYGTATAMTAIRNGIKNGTIDFSTAILRGGERLDTVAGEVYGDGRLWWILAAASDIGWCAQVPAGTFIVIPNPQDVAELFV